MDATLQLRLLGTPEVYLEGVSIAESMPNKTQAILYYLAVTGQTQPRSTLATLLWGDLPEAAARANLRKALARLRQTVGTHLKIDRQIVAFRPECNLWVDVVAFEANLGDTAHTTNIAQLQAAVELYRGDLLIGFHVLRAPDFEAWMLAEQDRLGELVIQALYALSVHHAERGELAQGIGYTRGLLIIEPWREEAHRQLMLLLAHDEQRSAALAQYDICQQVLAKELGVEPSEETLALYERIRDGNLSKGPPLSLQGRGSSRELLVETPDLITTAPSEHTTSPHNLPIHTTPFIGRDAELTELAKLLADSEVRLISIVGTGGMGKTRLALEAARSQLGHYTHGVYFVSLAPLDTTEAIVPTIAEALNFSFYEGGTPQQQLLDYLREKTMPSHPG